MYSSTMITCPDLNKVFLHLQSQACYITEISDRISALWDPALMSLWTLSWRVHKRYRWNIPKSNSQFKKKLNCFVNLLKFWNFEFFYLSTIPSNLLHDQFWQLAVKFHLWEGVWLNWCSNHGQNGFQSRQHTLQTFLESYNIYLKFQPFCLKAKCSLIEFKQTKNKTKKQGFLWIKPLYILTKIKIEITGQLKDNMT